MSKVVKKLPKKTLTWYRKIFKKTLPEIKKIIGLIDNRDVLEKGGDKR